MQTGCRRKHHPETQTSQKVTDKFAMCRQKKTTEQTKTGMDSPNTKISRGN